MLATGTVSKSQDRKRTVLMMCMLVFVCICVCVCWIGIRMQLVDYLLLHSTTLRSTKSGILHLFTFCSSYRVWAFNTPSLLCRKFLLLARPRDPTINWNLPRRVHLDTLRAVLCAP